MDCCEQNNSMGILLPNLVFNNQFMPEYEVLDLSCKRTTPLQTDITNTFHTFTNPSENMDKQQLNNFPKESVSTKKCATPFEPELLKKTKHDFDNQLNNNYNGQINDNQISSSQINGDQGLCATVPLEPESPKKINELNHNHNGQMSDQINESSVAQLNVLSIPMLESFPSFSPMDLDDELLNIPVAAPPAEASVTSMEMGLPTSLSQDATKNTVRPFKAYHPSLNDQKSSTAYTEFRHNILKRIRKTKGTNSKMRRVPNRTISPTSTVDEKDAAYWEKRRKNNEAAKRSRDARKAKEDEIAIRAAYLEQENKALKEFIKQLLQEIRYRFRYHTYH